MTVTTTSMSFGLIDDTVAKSVTLKEQSLNTFISTMDADPTTADLLGMQRQMTEWSLCVDVQATLAKTLSDTMKGVIQKAG